MISSVRKGYRDMECRTIADVEVILQEIYYRLNVIEDFLKNRTPAKAGQQQEPCYKGHKTKYGTFVESAKENWLRGILRNHIRILYRETLFHSKCCLCQNEDITVTSLTVKKKIRKQHVDYVIPLCGACKAKLEHRNNSQRESKSIHWGSVIKTPFETNRRKF